MPALNWTSIGFYCLFSSFVYYQQLHGRNFRGESVGFATALHTFSFLGMITGFSYLLYYGWKVVWWAPMVIFLISLIAGVIANIVEKLVGALAISLAAFAAWPVCAYFMFIYIP